MSIGIDYEDTSIRVLTKPEEKLSLHIEVFELRNVIE